MTTPVRPIQIIGNNDCIKDIQGWIKGIQGWIMTRYACIWVTDASIIMHVRVFCPVAVFWMIIIIILVPDDGFYKFSML